MNQKRTNNSSYMIWGVIIGASLGSLLGVIIGTITNNLAIGLAMGPTFCASIGLVIGVLWSSFKKRHK